MLNPADGSLLARVAERRMIEEGFLPHPPPEAVAEAASAAEALDAAGARDLSVLPWTSIDNPESRDLDQIEAVEAADGGTKLYVGIADVEHRVAFGRAIDRFAERNTTSVYTGARTFPMLPERYSFDLTSLVAGRKRLTVVIETLIAPDGTAKSGDVYAALTLNKAKLAYPSVSDWLDGKAPPPPGLDGQPSLQDQVRRQDALAKSLLGARRRLGALGIDTKEVQVVTDAEGRVTGLAPHPQTRAGDLIEELMIAANAALARALDARGQASIRRVVKKPERWANIVAYAARFGAVLPPQPSALDLSRFVAGMRASQPGRFAEISLALVKLIGRGEYEAHAPGSDETGHFGLAEDAYTHATAPNRRYADLVTQRLVKRTRDYSAEELAAVARRCTDMENAAKKVERHVQKSIAAMLLQSKIGSTYSGVVTGASEKGTFVRVFDGAHSEGKLLHGAAGLKVGDSVRVKLVDADVERGFIDFAAA